MNSHNPSDFRYRRATPNQIHEHSSTPRLTVRTVSSDQLFRGDHEIGIDHAGALYRLKITRQGKLILNK